MSYQMVLDTPLLVAYENMDDKNKVRRLHKKLVLPYLTNKKQWVAAKNSGLRISDAEHRQYLAGLANRPESDDDLVTLASKSLLKIILTEDENLPLPYVHYKKGMVNNQVTVTLSPSDNRTHLKTYLKMLCSNARKITICDNYFAQNWDNTCSLFHSILPRKTLTIEFSEIAAGIVAVTNCSKINNDFAHSIHPGWTVQITTNQKYTNCHDRYLLIESPEGKIEIMLSSGFDHIWKTHPKELTCIFRDAS
ncbi:hypothetical protein R0E42_000033 [Klebsiella variicola]|uniref:hypothetical protein n=1 Tax=Klebsiella variicola TaxID=244366 RepID=UPI000E2C9B9E|nr:hypothetical protein [Klebsiella variicola]ELN9653111.1 hypothetical protein [Klebsiella variicola]UVW48730.1 hypothetical protein NYO13_05855 [Klebsiella variicola]SXF31708.1 Uncharacterised protein [Klebsiella variicola]HCA9528658.1 hypothetical protein [Klebsiella variicola subsp. variicola]HCB1068627.1 hypothetical protein [Klebsiella variicola subsp. variicola]